MWAPDYITLAELKKLVDVDDVVDDAFLGLLPGAASRAVDRACGRQFGIVAAPEERYYPVRYVRNRRRWVAAIDDLQTTTGLILPAAIGTDYVLGPRNAVARGKAWLQIIFRETPLTSGEEEFPMTASWGWSAIPDAVKVATLLQANRWSSRKDSPYGIAGSPDQGSELRLLERVDPDVKTSLRDYRRDWWAV
jgi:hypothetical protein